MNYWAISTTLIAILASTNNATAAPTKEQCVAAHRQGQDDRGNGQLLRARKQFIACAQSSCPAVVQSDCARYSEELDKLVPSIGFAARDEKGNDLASASVYVDDALVTARLDDGKAHDIEPGRHTVRFTYDNKEVSVKIVVNQGEKGRTILGTFTDPNADKPDQSATGTTTAAEPSRRPTAATPPALPSRSVLPLVVAGIGVAAIGGGVVLTAVGLGGISSVCSNATKDCAAAPGDPVFADAKHHAALANVGVVVMTIGGLTAVGGVLWYVLSPAAVQKTAFTPMLGRNVAGLLYESHF